MALDDFEDARRIARRVFAGEIFQGCLQGDAVAGVVGEALRQYRDHRRAAGLGDARGGGDGNTMTLCQATTPGP